MIVGKTPSLDNLARPINAGTGLSLPDAAALIVGAAIASAHVRGAVPTQALDEVGWTFLWLTLAGVALTAAGPIVLLVRWRWRRPPGYPRSGDYLWMVLGLPWVLTAGLRPGVAGTGSGRGIGGLYVPALGIGVGLASLLALGVVWTTWVVRPPAIPDDPPVAPSWTERVGLGRAIAWPLQCGFAMVLCSP